MTEGRKATVQVVDEDGTVRAEYRFGEPTPEAAQLLEMLQDAMQAHGKAMVAAGKAPSLKDALSALVSLTGSFIAGAPTEAMRNDILKQVGIMLQVAIQQALQYDAAQHVQPIPPKGSMQ